MHFLTKLFFTSALLSFSLTATAYSCFQGGMGHCFWGIDKNAPEKSDLIDSRLFLAFCSLHGLHCSALDNRYHSIIGRVLDEGIFIIAGKGFGGPDLIFANKSEAEAFIKDFRNVATTKDTLFYVQNLNWPRRSVMAVGFEEINAYGTKEIKVLFLPNEWEESGEDITYSPPDMP